jgi:hypothetical protein
MPHNLEFGIAERSKFLAECPVQGLSWIPQSYFSIAQGYTGNIQRRRSVLEENALSLLRFFEISAHELLASRQSFRQLVNGC